MPQRIHKVKYGSVERMCFSKIKDTLEIPYLIALQKDSYQQFITTGIKEVLSDFSPVIDRAGRLELHYLDFTLDGKPKYDIKECKDRDATYSLPLKVKVRLVRKETGEITEEEVFMGDLPLITENGSFIINGAERVIVSQLVRSPGVYTVGEFDRTGVTRYETTIMPSRGAWLEFKQDANDILWVNVDRNRKVPATVLFRALGFGDDAQLLQLFGDEKIIHSTIDKDTTKNEDDAKVELYKKLRPGEIPTQDGITNLINGIFYDTRKYDFASVGRYKVNKKLSIASRITGNIAAEDIINKDTGEVFVTSGGVIEESVAKQIQNSGVNVVFLQKKDGGKVKIIGNNTVDLAAYLDG
ncbi:MAG: DNA-directed RNA polymerase subunit beta, partial [Clostridia bacterium]